MPRFYCACSLRTGITITLPEKVAHHLHVLRLAAGSPVTLFNGEGGEYAATLTEVERKRACAHILNHSPREAELPYLVTLAQALPEGTKMDWIIEKAVELGVSEIQPLAAQRCVVRLSAERAAKKIAHWQGIVIAASEQCGRNRLARLPGVAEFPAWVADSVPRQHLLLTPRASQSLGQWAHGRPPLDVSLLVGPEGGFTEEEERVAIAHGALPLGMGERVLRTETAGLAALAVLNAAWGQM